MQICKTTSYFPVINIETIITHYKPRKLTAFEWLILELIDKFEHDLMMLGVPLDTIISNVFHIPDGDKLVLPSIDTLMSLGIIRCNKYFSSLKELNIGDINFTEDGKNLKAKGEVPGAEKENKEEFYYDYLREKMLGKINRNNFLEKSKGMAICDLESDELGEIFPKSLIREQINKKNFSWMTMNSEIRSLKKNDIEVLWKPVSIVVNFDDFKNIDFICGIDEYDSYMSFMASDYLINIANLPIIHEIDNSKLNKMVSKSIANSENISNVFILNDESTNSKLKELLRKSDSGVVFITKDNEILMKSQAFNKNNLLIMFDETISDLKWEFDRNYRTGIMKVPQSMDDDTCMCLSLKGDNIHAGIFEVKLNDNYSYMELGYSLKQAKAITKANKLLDIVEENIEKIKHKDIDIVLVKLFWADVQDVWTSIFNVLRNSTIVLGKLHEYIKTLRALRPKESFTWKEDCINLLKAWTRSISSIKNSSELKDYLDYLCDNSLVKEENLTSIVLDEILDKIYEMKTIDDLEQVLSILSKYVKDLKTIDLYRFYSPDVVKQYLNKFSTSEIENLLKHRTKFETALYKLKKEEEKIKKKLNVKDIKKFDSISDYKNSIQEMKIEDMLQMCKRWDKAIDTLRETTHDYEQAVIETELGKIDLSIGEYKAFIQRYSNDIPRKYKNVYVIDTNVFVNKPDILNDFKETDLVILSVKVIDELDKLKPIEELKNNVRIAIKNIDSYGKNNIRFEKADVSLLSVDYNTQTPDNLILSVALKFKTSNPTVLTNDTGLRVKATDIEKINSQTLSEFLKDKASKSNNATKKKNKNKKNKKKR